MALQKMEAGAGLSSNRSEEVETVNLDMKRWADRETGIKTEGFTTL